MRRAALAVVAGVGLGGAGPAAAVTGVCPDGSVFVVSRPELIPCVHAKLVEPHEVPPLRPQNLPRPYTWQVYNETNDPNNAYNLVDSARQVRALRDAGSLGPEGSGAPERASSPAPRQAAGGRAARAPSQPMELGLTDGEMRDLFLIVELSQEHAPAAFSRDTADGREVLRVSLAHSGSFESRFAEAWGAARGAGGERVLLFTAVARLAAPFYANFSFRQAHLTFQPRVDDPAQFGVLAGRLGPLDADEVLLGYLVLPEQMQLALPIDVYWNDRRTTVTFQP